MKIYSVYYNQWINDWEEKIFTEDFFLSEENAKAFCDKNNKRNDDLAQTSFDHDNAQYQLVYGRWKKAQDALKDIGSDIEIRSPLAPRSLRDRRAEYNDYKYEEFETND